MDKKFDYISFFKTQDAMFLADLIAIRTQGNKYFIVKNPNGIKGFVNEILFKACLQKSSMPIVLSDTYINMEDFKEINMNYVVANKREIMNGIMSGEIKESDVYIVDVYDESFRCFDEITISDLKNDEIVFLVKEK